MTDNRVFLEVHTPSGDAHAWSLDGYTWSYVISEVHLGDTTSSTVFEMTQTAMKQVFEVPKTSEQRFSSILLEDVWFLQIYCIVMQVNQNLNFV